jgi:hypothetical protein
MLPRPTIEAFDRWLSARSLRLEAVVIGGSALGLLGVTERQTRDVDILQPELPVEILAAARQFAAHLEHEGTELGEEWLNNGPIELADVLPEGWKTRVRVAFTGEALELTTLGRADLLKTKLFALCDRGTDLGDCVALAPTPSELEEARPWLAERDTHPGWREHVRLTLEQLRGTLGHGV